MTAQSPIPDQLDELTSITPRGSWPALVAVAIALLAGVIWAMTAHIPRQVTLTAVVNSVAPQEASAVAVIPATQSGVCPVGSSVRVVITDVNGRDSADVAGAVSAVAPVTAAGTRVDLRLATEPTSSVGSRLVIGQQVAVTCTSGTMHPVNLLFGASQ